MRTVAIVGSGPAGLFAAECLAGAGFAVEVFDAMPAPGRKFLVAGHGGLNLTHAEPLPAFIARYGREQERFARYLAAFSPSDLRAWADGLGAETYVGSSGRVFPRVFKAAALLQAWLDRIRGLGGRIHPRHRLMDIGPGPRLRFATPEGEREVAPRAALLAMGGASWPQSGSDGGWAALLAGHGVRIEPFVPANCGFECEWSPRLRTAAGKPLKTIAVAFGEHRVRGELVITDYGLEGGALYALGRPLREALALGGPAVLAIDLKPDVELEPLAKRLASAPRGAGLDQRLAEQAKLGEAAIALVHERIAVDDQRDPRRLAACLKALPVPLLRPRPIAEAISSGGGIAFSEVDEHLMLKRLPGVFCAGEMLDWEAPTGGYLLQGCFSTSNWAAQGIMRFARGKRS
jgi:hypothetical protein